MGSAVGAMKAAATRLGMDVDEYAARVQVKKWCRPCKVWRPRTAFGVDRSRGDGLSSRCKSHGARRTSGPGKQERRAAALRGLSWCRRCEGWLSSAEVRQGICRPHANEYAREHYAATDGRGRRGRATARRRAVQYVGPETREWFFETTDGLCGYRCGREATSLDHVIPVAAGGITGPGLMVPACTSCNSSKRDGDPWPWIERLTPDAFDLVTPGLLYDGAVVDLLV